MKRCNENKGITLIALVVSIIVLLILAGVSISMLTGQNGILNRASEAKEKTEQAKQDEADKMAAMEAMVQTAGTKVTNPSGYGTNPNAQATADGAGKYFALPEGATYVEGTVDTGVVVNIKGSEFVWVPVDDVVLDKSRDNELPKSSNTGTDSGKIYTPMAVKVGNDYKGLLYDYDGANGYLKYGENDNYLGGSLDCREPDIVSISDGTEEDPIEGNITLEKLTKEYNEMIESVKKYKGFYVAQYEAGLDNTTNEIVFKNANLKENNTTTTNAANSETSSWYGLYQKIKTFTTDSDKLVSNMIWGSQYDAMMNWMSRTGNNVGITDKIKCNKDTVTGKNVNDVINNVYNLYGCNAEWTLEAENRIYRVSRGGNYVGTVLNAPAERHSFYDFPYSTYDGYSSRATLYIK